MANPPNAVFKGELDRLVGDQWLSIVDLKRQEYLVYPGEVRPYLYYVAEGALRVLVENEDEVLTIRFGYPGSFISTLDSFLPGGPSDYGIQALKKARVLPLARSTFLTAVDRSPRLAQLWQAALEQLVLQQLEREIDILSPSPQLRYQRVLQRSPQLFQEIPHKYIAAYLRMTPETLSRLKKS
ncbi:MAG: Crp/Fnr family transcriptional regulator [Bacteroidota bacterium]